MNVTAGSDAVDLYNSASGTWSTAQLSVARYGLAATSAGNVAIFAGGELFAAWSNSVDLYSTAAPTTAAPVIAAPSGYAASLACALTPATLTIVCTTAIHAVPVGVTKINFAAGELTTGAGVGASATGLTVATSVDTVSFGAFVPALVGTVQATTMTFFTSITLTSQVSGATVAPVLVFQ